MARKLIVSMGVVFAALACTTANAGSYNGWYPVGMAPQSYEEELWACAPNGGAVTFVVATYNDPDFVGSGVNVRISEDTAPFGRRTSGSLVLIEQNLPGAGTYVTSPALEPGDCFTVGIEVPGECVEEAPPGTMPPCARFSTPGITYRVQW
jgi:hypothetical protein